MTKEERRAKVNRKKKLIDTKLYINELAYRRGVQQGAHFALSMLANHEFPEVRKWVDKTLYEWRYNFRKEHAPNDMQDYSDTPPDCFGPVPAIAPGRCC